MTPSQGDSDDDSDDGGGDDDADDDGGDDADHEDDADVRIEITGLKVLSFA